MIEKKNLSLRGTKQSSSLSLRGTKQSSLIRYFINADDFGRSESVNYAIAECFERGYISATSLMVNMPYCDQAVLLSKEKGFYLNVGLHLNISEGFPLSESIKKRPKFVCKDGKFNKGFMKSIFNKLFLSLDDKKALTEEIDAQITKYNSYGLKSHIDTHQHMHTIFSIMGVYVKCLKKQNFITVRRMDYQYKNISVLKKIRRNIYNRILQRETNVLTDYLARFDCLPEIDLTKRSIVGMRFTTSKIVELYCHPDYDTDGRLINKDNDVDFEKLYSTIDITKLIKPSELHAYKEDL